MFENKFNTIINREDRLKDLVDEIKNNAEIKNRQQSVSISGRVFYDDNRNGTDDGEPGVEKAVIKLYTEDGIATEYTTISEPDGSYIIDNVEPGKYYMVVNNIPNDHVFIENILVEPHITKTGISNFTLDTTGGNPIENFNVPIAYNVESRGSAGPIGLKGCDCNCATFYSVLFNCKIIPKGDFVDLGNRISGNRCIIGYENGTCTVNLNRTGVYFITFEANAFYTEENVSNDYIGIQLKLNDYFIKQGFFYRKDNGKVYISTLIMTEPFKNNYIQFQNVGTKDIEINDVSLRIWRIS